MNVWSFIMKNNTSIYSGYSMANLFLIMPIAYIKTFLAFFIFLLWVPSELFYAHEGIL
jgi:hypothetical protein